jgi:alpha-glucosidase
MKHLIRQFGKSRKVLAVLELSSSLGKTLCLIGGVLIFSFQSKARLIMHSAPHPAQIIQAPVAKQFKLLSPDKNYRLLINIDKNVTYQLFYKGTKVLSSPGISLALSTGSTQSVLGKNAQVIKSNYKKVANTVYPVYGDFDQIADQYNELTIDFTENYSLVFRAYDQGVAYRFKTDFTDSLKVLGEKTDFQLAGDASADIAMTDNLTAWELPYHTYPSIGDIPDSMRAITPALFTLKQPSCRIIIAESNVRSYPGMYLRRKGNLLCGYWAAYPKKTVMGSWGDFVSVVKERENYIAKTPGKNAFPWRVLIATNNDGSLLTNKLIYLLADSDKLKDTRWIKPGKATWEWWHDAILPGVELPSGMDNRNTALYNYYVDFAAKNGLEYLMIDAGWSNVYDVKRPNPKIDIKEVINRATSKHVGVFLWCVASSLLKDLPGNLDYLAGLGIAGLKVDFFDRDDQVAAKWMEQIAAEAAKRHLLIDFHGCTKPSGLERTYPNIVNYEAVRGAECDKWDTTANPNHHLTIPFIRMLAGPMDYTPGALRNKTKSAFKPIGAGLPCAMGTRCHELAMYVIFDQPLAMLCDAPSAYERSGEVLKFLAAVPTTFDDTKVLAGSLGNFAALAKRSGNRWFVGAMTNWDPRDLLIDLSFLPKGKKFVATILKDGPNANQDATDYVVQKMEVSRSTKYKIHLASGGGTAIIIVPSN